MISVIIPTLNEASNLERLLAGLVAQDRAAEIIVVDGGSQDGTQAVANMFAVTLLSAQRGRGQQLLAGAEAASGDVLLFLHADSRFPDGGLASIETALRESPELVGGNFRVLFDGDSDFSRWLTGFYAWFRGHGLYYGDSAIFVRRSVYHEIGGIRRMALMEDYDFTRRLERAGPTSCLDEPALVTSSRRFEGRRPAAIVWGWIKIHALYHLGVPPRVLARIYNSERRAKPKARQRGAPLLKGS